MLEIIYSRERKSCDRELIERIRKDVSEHKKVTLLVPEQQVYNAEVMLSYNNIIFPELEVVGFRRLCESVFRRFGGLSYNNITDGARLILMWRTIAEISPMLSEYKNIALDDIDMIKSLMASVGELSLYGISPKTLEDIAEKVKDSNEKLSRKLYDIALIAAANSALLKNEYNDPAEDTKRVCEILEDNDYFSGRSVYIAHFNSFTVYEKKIIENIIKSADAITAFIGMDRGDKRDIFEPFRKTEAMLLKCAALSNISVVRTQLEAENAEVSDDIAYFCENIWDFSAKKYDGKVENIRVAVGESIEDESRFVAADIARKIREGGVRYRDFAVILRSTSEYEGVIDKALKNYGIPSFISARSDIKMRPSVRMILLALKIKSHNWQTEDVLAYMRCGYTGISVDMCDKIEEYANIWKISGKRWFDEHPWAMHPRGFGAPFTDEDKALLEELNNYRSILVSPLVKFFEIFEKKPTLRDVSAKLYNFLEEISLREKLEVRAAGLRDKNRVSEADETVQIWNILIDCLDSLVRVAGEMPSDSSSYLKLLSTSLEMSDIGKIPSGIDEVIIGEANSLKLSGVKHVYIIGLNEGVFPAPIREDAILGDRDRRDLEAAGVELSPESSERARDEMLYFYLAGSIAEKELVMTYNSDKNMSTFISSALSLFNDLEVIKISELPDEFFVWSDMSALEYSIRLRERDEEKSCEIKKYLEERGNIGFFAENDLINGEYRYTGDKKLFGEYMGLSQSRLESYAMCPFAYFCKYVLSLAEAPSGDPSSADIGNFVHSFLEHFIARVFDGEKVVTDELLSSTLEETMDICTRALGEVAKEPRIKMLLARLKDNLSLVVKSLANEFAVSQFRPAFFELKIGRDSLRPLTVELPDGTKAGVYGVIDRVDTYENDGKVYVRVVDYKTGKKVFSRADLQYGLNMQMLLYLASLSKTSDKEFLKKLGVKEGEKPIPAGILYFSTKMPEAEVVSDMTVDADKIEESALKKMKRIGLVCDDISLLKAMDSTLGGIYVPVSVKQDGSLSKNSEKSVVTSFDELFEQINGTVSELAYKMKQGNADATPLKTNNQDACRYCAMEAVCRRKSYCAEESEILHGVPDDESSYEGGRENG